MTLRNLVVLAVALAPGAAFSQDVAPEVLLLARIKAHMRRELAQMPNFTCVEALARYHKASGPNTIMKPLDTLQLEVAHIGGRELFSWLGERNFKEDNPAMFIRSGMIGSGVFASHLRALFLGYDALFQYCGDADLSGRHAACYSFQVPVRASGYEIHLVGASGTVGVQGRLWADPQSLDLIRIEIHADDIPPTLPIVDAITTIDYARMHIGETDVLMPQTGEMQLIEFSGKESRDVVEFTHCRSFNTESSIIFSTTDSPTPAAPSSQHIPAADSQETVPPGLLLSIVLTTPITEQAAVGQLIEAKVSGNVKYKDQVLIPDGSPVRGRIRRLERTSETESYFIVAIEFNEIQTTASSLRFFADLQSMDPLSEVEWFRSNSSHDSNDLFFGGSFERTTQQQTRLFDLPGVGSFFVRGSRFTLPKGLHMTWKTRALSH